jgi:heme-degrading monooxygenase HmoA
MYVALYRWKLKPGMEQIFETHWKESTLLYRSEQKGLGSRLHRNDDGTFFAYAQWPNRETYHAKRELSHEHKESLMKMNACIEEIYTQILGEVSCDLLLHSN